MRTTFLYSTVLLIWAFCLELSAQTTQIEGVLLDATGQPVAGATITLLPTATAAPTIKTPLRSTFSDEQGRFGFHQIKLDAPYNLHFHALGLKPKQIRMSNQSSNPILRLDTIRLQIEVQNLQEVVVQSTRKLIEFKPDRMVYHVENDADRKNSSLPELMQKIPLITLGANDNVELKGKTNYKILINGKLHRAFNGNVSELLKAYPSMSVKRIEVITAPGARYDAEGNTSGMINIVTANRWNGYNGTLSTSLNSLTRHSESASFSAKKGKLGLVSFGSIGGGHINTTSSFFRKNHYEHPLSQEQRAGMGRNQHRFTSIFAEMAYEPDSFNTFSLHTNMVGFLTSEHVRQDHIGLEKNLELIEMGVYEEKTVNDIQNWSLGGDYIRKFKREGKEFSLLMARNSGRNQSDLWYNRVFDIGPANTYNTQAGNEHEKELIAETNYTQPAFKNGTWSVGSKIIVRKWEKQYGQSIKSTAEGPFLPVPAQSGTFYYRQNIEALYSEYEHSWNTISFKAGLRYEATQSQGQLQDFSEPFYNQYDTWFPSAGCSWSIGEKHNLSSQYTRSIARPGLHFLNPQQNYSDPRNAFAGNPRLGPEHAGLFELKWNYTHLKRNINLSIEHGQAKAVINDVRLIDPLNGVVLLTFLNTGTKQTTAANLFYSDLIRKKTSITLNGRLAYEQLYGNTSDGVYHNQGVTGNASLNIRHSLPKTWSLQGTGSVHLGDFSLQGRNNLWYNYQVSLAKSVLKNKKLRLTLSLSQPFERYRIVRTSVHDPNFFTVSEDRVPVRFTQMRAVWRFGSLRENVSRKRGTESTDQKTIASPPE